MQRVTAYQGPARSGKWLECGCCGAAAGCCGPGCVLPGCPEPAGLGPRRPALAGGLRCSLGPAQILLGGGRWHLAAAAECPARLPAAPEGA